MRLVDMIQYFYYLCHLICICHIILRGMWNPSFTTTELEFFASIKTYVTILPNFTDKQIYLMGGKVGPFKANQPTQVPLWLAMHLKNNNKCDVVQPFWFNQQVLNGFIQNEKSNKQELSNLQSDYFFEISYIFLSKAPIIKISLMRGLIEGIENIRRQKIRKLFEQNRGSLRLKNLTTYEANRLREPLSKLAVMVDRLKKTELQRNKKQ